MNARISKLCFVPMISMFSHSLHNKRKEKTKRKKEERTKKKTKRNRENRKSKQKLTTYMNWLKMSTPEAQKKPQRRANQSRA